MGQGKYQRENTSHQLRNLLIIGAVVLVVLVLALAYIIPPTASMDEYLVANTLLNDTSKGPVIAWFQWALTPIHSLMMEFGLAPDWWDKSGSRLST